MMFILYFLSYYFLVLTGWPNNVLTLFQALQPLRTRVHSPMRWDERYAPYLDRVGLLPIARVASAGLPPMDWPLLTALVDRWRPETHTFHLPCGEITPTLQDCSMILALPIDGLAVTGIIDSANWRDLVEHALGVRPDKPQDGDPSKKTSGVKSTWLMQHFNVCPANAAEDVVERHARAWLWHMVASFLLPDAAGNTVSWLYLPLLAQEWENIGLYSWGSAVLAWLYRQMCDACERTKKDANLGGCTYLLQIWAWERLPVG